MCQYIRNVLVAIALVLAPIVLNGQCNTLKSLFAKPSMDSIERFYALEAMDTLINGLSGGAYDLYYCLEEINEEHIEYDDTSKSLLCYMLGSTYGFVGLSEKCLAYLDSAKLLAKEIGYEHLQSYILNDLGAIYMDLNEYEMAIIFLKESTKLYNLPADRFKTYYNLANSYMLIGNDSASNHYSWKMLAIANELNSKRLKSAYTKQRAAYYKYKDDYVTAKMYYDKYLEEFQDTLKGTSDLYIYLNYANILLKLNQTKSSKEVLAKVEEYGLDDIVDDILYEYHQIKYQIDSADGKYLKAIESQNVLMGLEQKMTKAKTLGEITKYKLLFELDLKEETIKNLQQEQNITQLKLKNRQITISVIFLTLALVMSVLIVLYFMYRAKHKSENKLKQLNRALEKAQEKLKLLNKDLEEASAELKQSNKELQQKNANKDQFVSMLAHDIKNPLNAILGFASLLHKKNKKIDANKLKLLHEYLFKSAENLMNLVEDILEWSRAQSSTLNYNPTLFRIHEIIYSTVGYLQPVATEKDITLKIDNANKEITVYADSHMVFAILRNLVSNAIKFTHSGGEVRIEIQKKEQELWLAVHDNGVGITKDEQENLFRMGLSYSNVGTNNEQGTGMGLAICKKFLEMNKGRIWLESQPSKGSSFWLSLPLSEKSK